MKIKKLLSFLQILTKISAFGPQSRFGIIHDVLGINAVDENIKVGTHGKSINSEFILEKILIIFLLLIEMSS